MSWNNRIQRSELEGVFYNSIDAYACAWWKYVFKIGRRKGVVYVKWSYDAKRYGLWHYVHSRRNFCCNILSVTITVKVFGTLIGMANFYHFDIFWVSNIKKCYINECKKNCRFLCVKICTMWIVNDNIRKIWYKYIFTIHIIMLTASLWQINLYLLKCGIIYV